MDIDTAAYESPVLHGAIERCSAAVQGTKVGSEVVSVKALDLALVTGFAWGVVARERARARAEREMPR